MEHDRVIDSFFHIKGNGIFIFVVNRWFIEFRFFFYIIRILDFPVAAIVRGPVVIIRIPVIVAIRNMIRIILVISVTQISQINNDFQRSFHFLHLLFPSIHRSLQFLFSQMIMHPVQEKHHQCRIQTLLIAFLRMFPFKLPHQPHIIIVLQQLFMNNVPQEIHKLILQKRHVKPVGSFTFLQVQGLCKLQIKVFIPRHIS